MGVPVITDLVATQAQNLFLGPNIDQISGTLTRDYWTQPPDLSGVEDPSKRVAMMQGALGAGPLYCDGWDTASLAGQRLPGLITVKCESQIQIDQQKAPGMDGAKLILRGYVPGPIEISVLLWTYDQWLAWNRVLPTFWRRPGKSAREVAQIAKERRLSTEQAKLYQNAVTIEHPGLSMLGITHVVVRGISVPEPGPQPQTRVIRLRCIEYREQTAAPTKTKKQTTPIRDDSRVPAPPPPSQTVGPRG